MAFCFKKKESVAKAVRRLCCERIDDALETLDRSGRLEAAHEVRKEIKKLRSVLRLVRHEISKNTYKERNGLARDVADRLTAFRDAQVRLTAFNGLMKHYPHRPGRQSFSRIKSALTQNCRAEEKKTGRLVSSLRGTLQNSRGQFGKLKIESTGWGAIAPGLKKVYERGRRALEAVRENPSPENFHEWRKRVKDLWHHLRLLCPARPRRLKARTNELEKLGSLLGDDHDLFMLHEFVAKKFMKARHADGFEGLIVSRQKELRSAALKSGRRFYREKSGHFCRQLGDYWKSWRHDT